MSSVLHQPNLTEGLSLIGWRLKRDAEIQARKNDANFECEVEPSSTSYAAFEQQSTTDTNFDPYSNQNLDLCLEVDSIDLNSSTTTDDYDPYEVFMRTNNHRSPLTFLPSKSTFNNNNTKSHYYNFADDDTPVKYPLAIGLIDKRLKQQTIIPRLNNNIHPKRVTFDEDLRPGGRRIQSNTNNNDFDKDIAPTVTEMDMLDDEEDNEPITQSYSSPIKLTNKSIFKRSNQFNEQDYPTANKRFHVDQPPARRGRPPSQMDLSKKLMTQFEEQNGLKLGELRVYAPKLRLRISNVNVNWINLPSIPNFPNKVHQS